MVRNMGNIVVMMAVLGVLGLILFYQVAQFCDDHVVEEMDGEIVRYEEQLLKSPRMIVKLTNGEEVEVRSELICRIGAKVHVVHVEGNCNHGWHMPDECPE